MSHLDGLREALAMARRRLAETTPHSPDWEAAMEAVKELEARLRAAGRRRRGNGTPAGH